MLRELTRPANRGTPWQSFLLAFLSALVLIAVLVLLKGPRAPEADEFIYLTIANDLNTTGVFTDGTFKLHPAKTEPGRFFAPAYPYFLHLVSVLDPRLAETIACFVKNGANTNTTCGGSVATLLSMQCVLSALQATSVFVIGWYLSRSTAIAALAFILALSTGEFGYYPRMYLTENLAFTGFFGFLAAFVWSFDEPRTSRFVVAGILLAVAALARPSYLYLIEVLIPILALIAILHRGGRVRLPHAGGFAAGVGLMLTPWIFRNVAMFGDAALTSGYGGFILAQRLSYNAMNWKEWGIAFIHWLPDFGDNLSRTLFDPKDYVRLGWDDPTSFYAVGNGNYQSETLKAAGGREKHLAYLMQHKLGGDLFKHTMVTLPLAWRGMWIGKYLSLIGFIAIWPVGKEIARQDRLRLLLALALPLAFMLGLHAFVSVNVRRYNVPIVALFSVTAAYAAICLAASGASVLGKSMRKSGAV